jgi:hypothetical protein
MALGRYTYLPWLRRGVANAITVPATTSSRAAVEVSLAVNDGEATGAPINKTFKLMGPGDILGFHPDLVVRTEPRPWVTDFEPNYLVFIDFYPEDFVWRHTPAPAGSHRLAPWLTLLVLEEGEYEVDRSPGRPLNVSSLRIKDPVRASVVPHDDQLWAWAHVQIAGDVGGSATMPDGTLLQRRLAEAPDSGVSRLICPRRLKPNTAYTAFVVPTFETGRKAGLGIKFNDDAEPGLAIAWRGAAAEHPILYEWYFRTGELGDFEDLVERMVPRPIDKRVGVRDIDIASPGFGMPVVPVAIGTNHHEGVVGLEGALKAPTTEPKPLDPRSHFREEAAKRVNAPADAQEAGESDPVVAPPLYGGWHVLVDRVDPAGAGKWVDDLNLDPRPRAAAGLGARVIQARQEEYMKLAWEQVGEVLAANRRATLFRFAQKAAERSFAKSFAPLPQERFLAVTAPVFARVLGSPATVRAQLAGSRLPEAALSPAFRKLTRPRGLMMKRALPPELRRGAVTALATALNDGRASAAPPPPPVAGPTLGGVADAVGAQQGNATWLARWGWWIFILLIVLAVLAFFAIGGAAGLAVGAAVAIGAAVIAAATVRARRVVDSAANLHIESLTPDAIPATPPPGFALTAPGSTATPAPTPDVAADFGLALRDFATFVAVKPRPIPPRLRFDLVNAHAKVTAAITPSIAFPKRAASVIRIGNLSMLEYAREVYRVPLVPGRAPDIVPVMAYPDLRQAMYRPLAELSNDFLVPNLGLVPPNTISLMLTNPPFIEAYMAGLNHEFARELLWREYPTDCRGTPFRQFWEVGSIPTPGLSARDRAERLKDIRPMHEWRIPTPLGAHDNRGGVAVTEHVVLVIRGDLLKRYPNTIIYAQDAAWSSSPKHADELALYDENGEKALANVVDPHIHYPIFVAPVAPDLTFIGFDAGLDEVRGDPALEETAQARARIRADRLGWFFVLQEVVGETRFGLDEHAPPPGMESDVFWDNLSWDNVSIAADHKLIDLARPFVSKSVPSSEPLKWSPSDGATGADIAAILRQKPVLVAVHARQMLERGKVDEVRT